MVRTERPDIEQLRESLIAETSKNKSLLQTLEDDLLERITSNQGNMLDNDQLVSVLENAKKSASEVTLKLRTSAETTIEMNQLRDIYRPVARRGSLLFFVLVDLSSVNSMYQYSLSSYLEVFALSLKMAPKSAVLTDRLDNVIDTLSKNVYDFGCAGIFERDKVLFSFQICLKLQQSDGVVSGAQVEFFAKGSVALERSSRPTSVEWLKSEGWEDVLKLSRDFPGTFSELPKVLERQGEEWKEVRFGKV